MVDRRASVALPIATLILAALAVSFCRRPSAVNYAAAVEAGRSADSANRDFNDEHGEQP